MFINIRLISFVSVLSIAILLSSCGAKKKSQDYNSGGVKERVDAGLGKKDSKSRINYYAELLTTNPKELNADLYSYIDKWMGAPHRLGGETLSGIDCSAFVSQLYKEVYQKKLPRTSRDMAEIVKRKFDKDLKEGDLLFFSFGGKQIDHVGIYLWNDKFVHVSTKQGVVISNLKDLWYYKYFTRCGTPIF